jgi:hypothetical protein
MRDDSAQEPARKSLPHSQMATSGIFLRFSASNTLNPCVGGSIPPSGHHQRDGRHPDAVLYEASRDSAPRLDQQGLVQWAKS